MSVVPTARRQQAGRFAGGHAPRLVAGLLATALCCSCARLDDVERDWGETMARYKMIGVFPITEDLQPGDILLDVPPSASSDPQPKVTRLGSIDPEKLKPALGEQDRLRLRLEGIRSDKPAAPDAGKPAADEKGTGSTVMATATAQPGAAVTTTTTIRPVAAPPSSKVGVPGKGKASPAGVAPDADAPAKPNVLDADSTQTAANAIPRLRRVALPGIIAARVYDWQLAGAGPIGRLVIGLGLSGNGSAAVLITLRKLQTLGLDALAADDLFERNVLTWLREKALTPRRLLSLTHRINPEPVARICQGRPAPDEGARALIRVVGRVMYAHEIQYEYTRTSQVAGRLAAELSLGSGANAGRPVVPGPSSATMTAPPGATASIVNAGAATDAANARLAALQADLASASPTTPGVRASVGVGTYGNSALNESYLRPMAVGFNVLTSYAVRDSLVVSAASQDDARWQLEEARAYCGSLFGPVYGEPSAPIARTVCTNTAYLRYRHPDEGVVVPTECAGQSVSDGIPLQEIGPQRRDLQPRAF